jgi:hypothetical protein
MECKATTNVFYLHLNLTAKEQLLTQNEYPRQQKQYLAILTL